MFQGLLLSSVLLSSCCLPAPVEKQQNWLEVRSPDFVVITDANQKQGRRIAGQFERMRSVFQAAFPKLPTDPGTPIIVLAVKDEKNFRALEPQEYLAKGSLKLGGLFLRAPDKNYVLMRLGAVGEHPYAVIYHEYTHLLMSRAFTSMPLWLREGLAEFYENTEIRKNEALLGAAGSGSLQCLRENRLLPLATLFGVDETSPYYHDEKKGSIFYAESWALTHFIHMTDLPRAAHRLSDYSTLLAQNVDPVTAATRVFGDLKQLQSQLEDYLRQGAFPTSKITTATQVDDSVFKVQPLSAIRAMALQADFLASEQRTADAEALLDQVLQKDPDDVAAHETRGYIAFREGRLEQARESYRRAVQLDPQQFLAHYYFAAISMYAGRDASEQTEIESSLRAAVRLAPSYAPAFDKLATFLTMYHKDLGEARTLALTAVNLDPANIGYRVNLANVLTTMGETTSAFEVLRIAAKSAKTLDETQMVADALTRAHRYADARARSAEQDQRDNDEAKHTATSLSAQRIPALEHRLFVAKGPHRFSVGVLNRVSCDGPGLDVTLAGTGKRISLHVDNYFKLPFTALGFPSAQYLNPCTDLENRPAKIEYVESANPSIAAQLLSVELHK